MMDIDFQIHKIVFIVFFEEVYYLCVLNRQSVFSLFPHPYPAICAGVSSLAGNGKMPKIRYPRTKTFTKVPLPDSGLFSGRQATVYPVPVPHQAESPDCLAVNWKICVKESGFSLIFLLWN
jgi:hypothetical protein